MVLVIVMLLLTIALNVQHEMNHTMSHSARFSENKTIIRVVNKSCNYLRKRGKLILLQCKETSCIEEVHEIQVFLFKI